MWLGGFVRWRLVTCGWPRRFIRGRVSAGLNGSLIVMCKHRPPPDLKFGNCIMARPATHSITASSPDARTTKTFAWPISPTNTRSWTSCSQGCGSAGPRPRQLQTRLLHWGGSPATDEGETGTIRPNRRRFGRQARPDPDCRTASRQHEVG